MRVGTPQWEILDPPLCTIRSRITIVSLKNIKRVLTVQITEKIILSIKRISKMRYHKHWIMMIYVDF